MVHDDALIAVSAPVDIRLLLSWQCSAARTDQVPHIHEAAPHANRVQNLVVDLGLVDDALAVRRRCSICEQLLWIESSAAFHIVDEV